jgi:hypothetical protein
MKKEISPVQAVIAIIAVLVVVGIVFWQYTSRHRASEGLDATVPLPSQGPPDPGVNKPPTQSNSNAPAIPYAP